MNIAYLLVDSTLLQAFHRPSESGIVSNRLVSSNWPSVAANSPCLCAIFEHVSFTGSMFANLSSTYRYQIHVEQLALLKVVHFLACYQYWLDWSTEEALTPVIAARLTNRKTAAKVERVPSGLSLPTEQDAKVSVILSNTNWEISQYYVEKHNGDKTHLEIFTDKIRCFFCPHHCHPNKTHGIKHWKSCSLCRESRKMYKRH